MKRVVGRGAEVNSSGKKALKEGERLLFDGVWRWFPIFTQRDLFHLLLANRGGWIDPMDGERNG